MMYPMHSIEYARMCKDAGVLAGHWIGKEKCGAPKPQRRAQRRPRGKLGYKPVHIVTGTLIYRELFILLLDTIQRVIVIDRGSWAEYLHVSTNNKYGSCCNARAYDRGNCPPPHDKAIRQHNSTSFLACKMISHLRCIRSHNQDVTKLHIVRHG